MQFNNMNVMQMLFDIFISLFFCFMHIDSTYTERYMGMPNLTDNYQGYEEGDLSKHVDQLRDKQFLLVNSTFFHSSICVFHKI